MEVRPVERELWIVVVDVITTVSLIGEYSGKHSRLPYILRVTSSGFLLKVMQPSSVDPQYDAKFNALLPKRPADLFGFFKQNTVEITDCFCSNAL